MDNDATRRTALVVLAVLLVAILASMVFLEINERTIPQPLVILMSSLSGMLAVVLGFGSGKGRR